MGVTAQSAKQLVIGAGNVLLDGGDVGVTQDNNVFTIMTTLYSPHINGVPGRLKGTDYIQEQTAELETTLPEISQATLPAAIPGGAIVPGDAAGNPDGTKLNTTLASNSLIGDTNIKVTAVTPAPAVGDILMIGVAGFREFRTIKAVGTLGAAGTGIDLVGPLALAHTALDPVINVAYTTLSADAGINSTNLKVVSVAGLVVGGFVRFGYPGEMEIRQLTSVGTAGAGGTGIGYAIPTVYVHRAGDFLLAQTNEGSSRYTSNAGVARRLPSSSYHTWELRVDTLDGRAQRFLVYNAINIDHPKYEAGDGREVAPRLKLQARWDPASPQASCWDILSLVPA